MEPVAITGLGVISSIGQDVETFCDNLMAAKAAVGPTPWNNEEGMENVWISLVDGFEPLDWMDERVAAGSDPFAQYMIAAAVQAVEASGIEEFDPFRTGVVMGTCQSGAESLCKAQQAYDERGADGVPRKLQIMAWPNMAAGQISLRWGLHGPLLTVSTACASSVDAMGVAARMINAGQADVIIAGGGDSARSLIITLSAGLYGMYTRQPDPALACLPFDIKRNGIMGGEGAGVVILESAEHAAKRGAHVHGYIRGYGQMADASHPSSPEPNGKYEAMTMQMAIKDAGLPGGAADVDGVVAHGTATTIGDTAEIRAINSLHKERHTTLRVASVKGHVGHTVSAAGAMNLMAALRSMEIGAFAPTAGTTDVDPEAEFEVVTRRPSEGPVNVVQVNGFGFGGQNASLIVTRQ